MSKQWTNEEVRAVINEVLRHYQGVERPNPDGLTANGTFAAYILDARAEIAQLKLTLSGKTFFDDRETLRAEIAELTRKTR